MSQDPKVLASSDGVPGKLPSGVGLFANPPAGATETYYQLSSAFYTLPNKLVFAKATSDDSPARVFQVGSKISYKTVSWVARRVNCPPKSPEPETSDDWTLLYTQVNGTSPGVGVDGVSKFYEVSGSYVYVSTNAFDTSTEYNLGIPPIYTYSVESATLTPDDFGDVTETGGEVPSGTGASPVAIPSTPSGQSSSPATTNNNPGGPPRRLRSLFDG